MTQRGHAKFFEVRVGEPAENVVIDIVLGKRPGILGQSQIPQPLLDGHVKQDPRAARNAEGYSLCK